MLKNKCHEKHFHRTRAPIKCISCRLSLGLIDFIVFFTFFKPMIYISVIFYKVKVSCDLLLLCAACSYLPVLLAPFLWLYFLVLTVKALKDFPERTLRKLTAYPAKHRDTASSPSITSTEPRKVPDTREKGCNCT